MGLGMEDEYKDEHRGWVGSCAWEQAGAGVEHGGLSWAGLGDEQEGEVLLCKI